MRHGPRNQVRIPAGKEYGEVITPIATSQLQLSQYKPPEHQRTTPLNGLHSRPARRETLHSLLGRHVVVANLARVGSQLTAHKGHPWTYEAAEVLTVSVGMALRRDGETPQAFYSRADRLLYEAKHSGRNRSAVYPA